MTTPNVPARFFLKPGPLDAQGKPTAPVPSTIQIGPNGRPVEVKTPEQFAEWQAIQDAAPPSSTQAAAQMMARMAGPLFSPDAEREITGPSVVKDLRIQAAMAEGTAYTEEIGPPKDDAEGRARMDAAVKLAAALDFSLVWVPVTDALGAPPHLELRQGDNPYARGDLVSIERMLHIEARERELRNAQVAAFHAHQARIERDKQAAIYNLPENRIARLEAANAELAGQNAALMAKLDQLAERVSA